MLKPNKFIFYLTMISHVTCNFFAAQYQDEAKYDLYNHMEEGFVGTIMLKESEESMDYSVYLANGDRLECTKFIKGSRMGEIFCIGTSKDGSVYVLNSNKYYELEKKFEEQKQRTDKKEAELNSHDQKE